jgi:kinesin family protein 6/9
MSVRQPIRVVVRNRPSSGSTDNAIELGSDGQTVSVRQLSHTPTGGAKADRVSYKCDAVLANASQERVFEEVGLPLCETVLQGYNATALCYGQTSSGKSFTMIGNGHDYHHRGLLPRALARIFRDVSNRLEYSFTVGLQCLEIYNESMYDLLATLPGAERRDLSICEVGGSVEVKGLSAPQVTTEEEALRLVFEAEANRAVSQHQLNAHSSRSHVFYILSLERRSRVDSSGAHAQRADVLAGTMLRASLLARDEFPDKQRQCRPCVPAHIHIAS